jgi:formyltetrahydrofolate synthetase
MAEAQKKRIGDVHCGKQTNYGTAADDSEVLYVVSLSSRVDHLPSELRKNVSNMHMQSARATVKSATGGTAVAAAMPNSLVNPHLLQEVRLLPGKIGGGPGHIVLYFEDC